MERRAFPTPLGEVWLWGERAAFEGDRPVALAICGAFANEKTPLFGLQPYVPDADVLLAHIPGNHCPTLVAASAAAYGSAYGHALRTLGRPAVVVGESAGALAALAMREPLVRGLLLLEPPLVTGKLWPLFDMFREKAKAPEHRGLVENVFGYIGERVEGRDYRPLLAALSVPTRVAYGDEPLGDPRPISRLPSLVDEPERELMRRHPLVRTLLVQGAGHNVVEAHNEAAIDQVNRIVAETLA